MHNSQIGIALAIRFQKRQLPWLTNWQHWDKGEYVTGLEPGSNRPIGQAKAREQDELIMIAPGEKRKYELEIALLSNKNEIDLFLDNQ